MMQFIETTSFSSFVNLLITVTMNERWEKCGDGNDAEKESKMGPILAESAWTMIDLLKHIGLHEQADFYQDKLYKHIIPPREAFEQHSYIEWEYETRIKKGSEEYKRANRWRRLWESLRILKDAESEDSVWGFDADDPMWPAHKGEELTGV
jgi:hypothetical protein